MDPDGSWLVMFRCFLPEPRCSGTENAHALLTEGTLSSAGIGSCVVVVRLSPGDAVVVVVDVEGSSTVEEPPSNFFIKSRFGGGVCRMKRKEKVRKHRPSNRKTQSGKNSSN